jgi:hypothetical protein
MVRACIRKNCLRVLKIQKINDLTENDGCSNVKDGNGSVMAEVKTVKENGNIDNDVKSNFDDSHSINKGCNQACNCCKKNDKRQKKRPVKWMVGYFNDLCFFMLLLFAFLPFLYGMVQKKQLGG